MRDPGILKICSLQNIATTGHMPKEQLVEVADAYYFEEHVGVTRAYSAMAAQHQIDLLVKVYNTAVPVHADYVLIGDDQYRIDLQQKQGDDVLLTLIRLETLLDVYGGGVTSDITEQT